MFWQKKDHFPEIVLYDRVLLLCTLILVAIGFVMVSSTTISLNPNAPFAYVKKEAIHLILATIICTAILFVRATFWKKISAISLFFTLFLLILVLFISPTINGASRWISLGFMNFQPAELTKLVFFCYLASYLSRKVDEVQTTFWGFCKPMMVLLVLSVLLLKQPDLGTVITLFIVTLGVLFIAGAKVWQFIVLIFAGVISFSLLIIFEPYRLKRVTGFLDPWQDQYDSGYQLTNSLMAIGNGGFWGKGLGNSIRKLGYLPEAHTDFIFAIIGEELGYIGCIFVLVLMGVLVWRAISIGRKSLSFNHLFSGYFACQIALWFSCQTLINVGVVSGLLPTKGLTFPLVSYGGSSLLIMLIAVAILLRIDFENRQLQVQVRSVGKKHDKRS